MRHLRNCKDFENRQELAKLLPLEHWRFGDNWHLGDNFGALVMPHKSTIECP